MITKKGKESKTVAYDDLRYQILTTKLRPGSDIDETALTARFGLSRTPMREVLRQLAGEGYVELRENRSPRVTDLSLGTLRDFFAVAPMVYAAVLRLAARNATPAQIDALRAAQAKLRDARATQNAAARALANNQFHEITGEMTDSIYLLPSFRRLLIDHARIGTMFFDQTSEGFAENSNRAAKHHDEIIQAICEKNEERAAELAAEHWNLSRGQIEKYVMSEGLAIPLGA